MLLISLGPKYTPTRICEDGMGEPRMKIALTKDEGEDYGNQD